MPEQEPVNSLGFGSTEPFQSNAHNICFATLIDDRDDTNTLDDMPKKAQKYASLEGMRRSLQ